VPKGPKGEKRPADVIGNAVKVMRIATGEEQEDISPTNAAATLGKLGGKARAVTLSGERRREIARNAAKTRWEGQAQSAQEKTKQKDKMKG
jgi:hypothetical protein